MNIAGMMKKAQQMQQKMQDAQAELETITETGTAGADLVTVVMSGKHELKEVKLSPDLLNIDDKEMLEDLIIAAVNDAKRKIDTKTSAEMEKATVGMGLPGGMKLPF